MRPAAGAAALLPALLGACGGDEVAGPEARLEIVPDSVTLTHVGARFEFSVRGGGGSAGAVRWASRDPAVFVVDANGAVTARGNGVAHVVASNLESSDEALVRVRQVAAALEAFGDGQRSTAAQPLPEPVGVRVLDAGGAPVARARVRFEPGAGSGRADPQVATTDSVGLATTAWTLGPEPGRQTLRAASAVGGAGVEIAATAIEPDEAVASFEVHSGEDQWALAGRALPEPVVVRVLDEAGRPVRGASVRFEPGAGSGRADPAEAVSDSMGLAAAAWTLGERLGAQRLVATTAREATAAFEATAVSDEGACNRTPAVSEAIARALAVQGVAGCAEVTEEHLKRVDYLYLAGQGITRLQSGDFAGLANLEHLVLHTNRLKELPKDLLSGLSSLRYLSLASNQLAELPEDVFADLPGLEQLTLHGNELRELPPRVFADLPGLKQLTLGGNELRELPPRIFVGLSRLEELLLLSNRLEAIPPDLFKDLAALERLWLGVNRLAELPPGIFAGLTNLRSLALNSNRLVKLPRRLFQDLSSLTALSLDGNAIESLPPDVFAGLSSLRTLNLDRNGLVALPPGIFAGLPELVKLDLSVNGLAGLPEGVFTGTPKLAQLSLDHNELTELPRGVFAGLSELEWVTLDGNPGSPFPVRPEFARIDAEDPLAPGPARVAVRMPLGAPFALDFRLSVQRGKSSHDVVSLLPGDTVSAPFVVSGADAGAVHVGFGPPPEVMAAGHEGLALLRGEELVLFAESDNRSPVARSPVPAHRLQAGGPSAELVLGDYFEDPDGDSLAYEAATMVEGVVDVRVEDGVLWLESGSVDTTEVEVAATDPGGLRAVQRFRTWVVPAPDPDAFNIELYFEPGFTVEEEAAVRRAADRWMEAVTGDLPDVPVHGQLEGYCFDHPSRPRVVGVIDDVLIRMRLDTDLGRNVAAASACGRREESGHTFLGGSSFALWYARHPTWGVDRLYRSALHEIGHVLGIGYWAYRSRPQSWRDLFRGKGVDAHFAGLRAVAAFDAAGGEAYAGGKVPLEDSISILHIHWRKRVIPDDIMAPGGGSLLTAITLGALADLGYEVDLGRADPYTLPMSAQGDVRVGDPDADEAGAEVLADDVIEVPVMVVDRDGKVVRVIRR